MIQTGDGSNTALFLSAFRAADIAISIIDEKGYFKEVNEAFCKLYRCKADTLIGLHFTSVVPEEQHELVIRKHTELITNNGFDKEERSALRTDGTSFFAQITSVKINDENGEIYRVTTISDITDRKRNDLIQSTLLKISQEASQVDNPDELYKLIHLSVGRLMPVKNFYIALYDEQNDIVTFPYFIDEKDLDHPRVFYNAKNNKGITASIIRQGKTVLNFEDEIQGLIKTKKIHDAGPIPVVYLGTPLKIREKTIGVMAVQSYDNPDAYADEEKQILEIISDQVARVVERYNYEKELIEARESAEQSNRIKSEFLAQISHEIRTPINSILSFSNLIRTDLEGIVSDELKISFDMIERGGKRLIRTIDLLLNVSQLQTGNYKADLVEVDLANDILSPLASQFGKVANDKGLELTFEANVEAPCILCDYYSINQLFINLIDNAIKYTKQGSISIVLKTNVLNQLQVDVMDTGIGISDGFKESLFDNFTQEETGYTRRFEGIGLGLSLVKQYAELNRAEIFVESKKGEGSKFSVIFSN